MTPTLMRAVCLSLMLGGSAAAQAAADDGQLTILWTERKPFQYTDGQGNAKGVLVELGTRVFNKAGISHTWDEAPANRVINVIRDNDRPVCAVGWYKSKERESFAQFSRPLYQDLPLRGVFRKAAVVKPGATAKDVIGDQKTSILLKLGFAYGPFLDELISQKKPSLVERVSVDIPNMLLMVQSARADVVLLSQEEIDYYGATDPSFKRDFKAIVFDDMPEVDQRYIMCSKRVSPKTMKKINDAIAVTVKLKA